MTLGPADIEGDEQRDPWLTVAEFAEALRVRPVTVRSWISKGELKATRAGRRKWLIRRSEVTRMLEGRHDNTPTSELPEPGGGDAVVSAWSPLTPPIGTRESVTELLRYAAENIGKAFKASELAPPSAGYPDRLRAIADGFEHYAATSIHAGNTAGATWAGRDDWGPERLPYEMRPGGNRPGSDGLWDGFDAAFAELGSAIAGRDILTVGLAFRKAADELLDVADQLGTSGERTADSTCR